ncbi:hypothetical protein IHE45_02G035600 [Dioscorea alata]|uniref:Uncharacterized protein n=1 Tax=Dioscorea alata TaxID=55571 RepID=A0ACB7WP08_DIOAL|nr:hypothetical protein IHE45_02G035600 [Dioscorea alata]
MKKIGVHRSLRARRSSLDLFFLFFQTIRSWYYYEDSDAADVCVCFFACMRVISSFMECRSCYWFVIYGLILKLLC